MPILLCRIDDRLIHGQLVIGWGQRLAMDLIILVNDEVAASPWEQELYRMAVPPSIEVVFAGVRDAAARLADWHASERRGVLLTGDIQTMIALHRSDGAVVRRINLGGIHHRPGRVKRLPYVYLTEEELGLLRDLEATGAQVTAQDVPSAAPVGLRNVG